MDFATIQSAEYADYLMKKGTPEQFDQIPVGTGPFQFVDYQKDAVIRFKANPDYWGGKPKIDDLVYAITPDPTARYAKLKANECQVMIAPNPADLEAMSKDADVNLLQQAGLNIGYLAHERAEAALRQDRSAPGDRHGDRPRCDPEGGLSGRRPEGQEPDPADHLVL